MDSLVKALDSLKEFLKSTEKNLQVSLIKSKIDDPTEWQIDCSTRTLNELSLVDLLKGMSNRTAVAKNQIKELEEERRILPFTDKVLTKKKEYDIKKKEIQFESKNFKISPNTKVLVDGKHVVNLSEMATTEYWLNGFEKIKDKLIDGAYEIANTAIMGAAQIASAWFSGSLTRNGNDSATLKLSEDFSNPITVLRNREPDFFSNMYNIFGISNGEEAEGYWATRIEGIDIPTAKRSTTKRNFCGREIEVVGSEVELNKVCTIRFAIDQDYTWFYGNSNNAHSQTKMNVSKRKGLFYNFIHDNKKHFSIYIDYSDLYTAISEDSNGKVHYNFKKDKNASTTDLYEKLDDKYKNKFMAEEPTACNRRFIFKDVKFIAENSTDLEYDSQSANEMIGEMKFIYKRVVESKI